MTPAARPPNGFLASLSEDDFELVRPHLKTVDLTHVRRTGVPKVVKSNARELRRAGSPHLRQAAWLNRRAVLARINEGGIGLPYAEPEEFLGLT